MPLELLLICLQQLQDVQLQVLLQRFRSVVVSFAKTNVADKWINTKGELCALLVCLQTNGINVALLVALLLFMQFAQFCPPIQRGSVILVLKHLNVCLVFLLSLLCPLQQWRKTAMNFTFLIQTPTCILFFAIRVIDSTTLNRVGKHGNAVIVTQRFMRRK
jgi:hypothetical protein